MSVRIARRYGRVGRAVKRPNGRSLRCPARRSRMEDKGTGRVQSVDRAVALVHAVADSGPLGETAATLAERCGLNRATAWRLLATLEHHGVLERDPASNRYTIGLAVDRWAAGAGVDGLVRRAHDTVVSLSERTG